MTTTAATTPALLLDAAEAAALCGVSRSTWFGWQAAGAIPAPALRRGRVVRWRREELVAWVSADCPSADRWRAIRPEKTYAGRRL